MKNPHRPAQIGSIIAAMVGASAVNEAPGNEASEGAVEREREGQRFERGTMLDKERGDISHEASFGERAADWLIGNWPEGRA